MKIENDKSPWIVVQGRLIPSFSILHSAFSIHSGGVAMLNGRRIRTLRRRARWTQQMLAEAVGVYQPYISKLELGKHQDVKTARLAALADALGVPIEQLIVAERKDTPHA